MLITPKSTFVLFALLALLECGLVSPWPAVAQEVYYTWYVSGVYTDPYQEFPASAMYPFEITGVTPNLPRSKSGAPSKSCQLHLKLFDEETTVATNPTGFDVDPTMEWRTDGGCVLEVVGKPDLNAQVALVSKDSATLQALRQTTMNVSVFPDYGSRNCQKISVEDLNAYTQILFPAVVPTPTPTPNIYAGEPTPSSTPKPRPAAPGSRPKTKPTTLPKPEDLGPVTITVPWTTSIRTVTYYGGPDCKSLVVFRPWNE